MSTPLKPLSWLGRLDSVLLLDIWAGQSDQRQQHHIRKPHAPHLSRLLDGPSLPARGIVLQASGLWIKTINSSSAGKKSNYVLIKSLSVSSID